MIKIHISCYLLFISCGRSLDRELICSLEFGLLSCSFMFSRAHPSPLRSAHIFLSNMLFSCYGCYFWSRILLFCTSFILVKSTGRTLILCRFFKIIFIKWVLTLRRSKCCHWVQLTLRIKHLKSKVIKLFILVHLLFW